MDADLFTPQPTGRSSAFHAASGSPVTVDDAIYPYGRMMMCHMMSKDLDTLHAMADRIGISRRWFQNKKGGTPHYDICKSKRALAIQAGAIETDRHGIVEIIRHFRQANAESCHTRREPTTDCNGND